MRTSMRSRRRAAGRRVHFTVLKVDDHLWVEGRWTSSQLLALRRNPWQLFRPMRAHGTPVSADISSVGEWAFYERLPP